MVEYKHVHSTNVGHGREGNLPADNKGGSQVKNVAIGILAIVIYFGTMYLFITGMEPAPVAQPSFDIEPVLVGDDIEVYQFTVLQPSDMGSSLAPTRQNCVVVVAVHSGGNPENLVMFCSE
jgi:hypothetical protein